MYLYKSIMKSIMLMAKPSFINVKIVILQFLHVKFPTTTLNYYVLTIFNPTMYFFESAEMLHITFIHLQSRYILVVWLGDQS